MVPDEIISSASATNSVIENHSDILWSLIVLLGGFVIALLVYIWRAHKATDTDKFARLEKSLATSNSDLERSISKSNTDLARSITKLATSLEHLAEGFANDVSVLHGRITESDKEALNFRADILAKLGKICATCREREKTCPGRNPEFMRRFGEIFGNRSTDLHSSEG